MLSKIKAMLYVYVLTGLLFVILLFKGTSGFSNKKASKNTVDTISITPEMFAMPRTKMAFVSDRMVRLFNGYGSICIRDKSLTGLQTLFFPPIDVRDYNFSLAFLEHESNILIQDVVLLSET